MGQVEHETDAKNRTSRNYDSELTNLLEMVKKHFRLLNRSIMMSELGVRPKLQFWAKFEHETDLKNRTSKNAASDLTNPLQMVKKTFQAFEALNSDVRARS